MASPLSPLSAMQSPCLSVVMLSRWSCVGAEPSLTSQIRSGATASSQNSRSSCAMQKWSRLSMSWPSSVRARLYSSGWCLDPTSRGRSPSAIGPMHQRRPLCGGLSTAAPESSNKTRGLPLPASGSKSQLLRGVAMPARPGPVPLAMGPLCCSGTGWCNRPDEACRLGLHEFRGIVAARGGVPVTEGTRVEAAAATAGGGDAPTTEATPRRTGGGCCGSPPELLALVGASAGIIRRAVLVPPPATLRWACASLQSGSCEATKLPDASSRGAWLGLDRPGDAQGELGGEGLLRHR